MSNFNLDQAEVVELNAVDMHEVEGGSFWQDVKDFFSGIGDGFSHPSK
ncbi:hypothetical protein [Spirosoma rhododendri]|uniref:Uncharacterized protein n=1 Tax=Spirosoma rhododendri TaxID=2728024 RepID=A0A7L5DRH6_9BACT|nr:hypothetical protein [Spirosoma rhododendri]QJD81049.1 hypothetical protein HH216_23450 [Spirosoma rhododendri]